MFAQTGCSASARGRDTKKPRFLTVTGPVAQLEAAYNLTTAAIAENLQLVERGEKLVTEEAAAAPADPQRIAAAKARRERHEMKPIARGSGLPTQHDDAGRAQEEAAAILADSWRAHNDAELLKHQAQPQWRQATQWWSRSSLSGHRTQGSGSRSSSRAWQAREQREAREEKARQQREEEEEAREKETR